MPSPFCHASPTQKRKPPDGASPEVKVYVIKKDYFRSLLKVDKKKTLCLMTSDPTFFEIIYYNDKHYYSVWRFTDKTIDKARDRFNLMATMLELAPFYNNQAYRADAQNFLQRLVNVMSERPIWKEVHIAAANGYHEYFETGKFTPELINSQTDPDRMTPLQAAICYEQSGAVVKAILKHKPSIALLDAQGNSVLHWAARNRHVSVLQEILKLEGVRELLKRNSEYWSPVEYACFQDGLAENMKTFLKWGLTPRMATMIRFPGEKISPADAAFLNQLSNDDKDLIKFNDSELKHMKAFADGGCPLHWVTKPKHILRMLDAGFQVDTPNIKGDTPLGVAVKFNIVEAVIPLLYSYANANLANNEKETPLSTAVLNGNVPMVKALIIFNADINLPGAQGLTPRHLAATGAPKSHQEILSLLTTMGAAPCDEEKREEQKCVTGCWAEPSKNCGDPDRLNFNSKHQLVEAAILAGKIEVPAGGKPEMMVCFDGGGIRGLLTVQMMLELSKFLTKPFHEYFDWLSGTSTGSLVGWALSTGRSLPEILRLYFTLKDQVFIGRKPFDASNLERSLKAEFGENTTLGDIFETHGKRAIAFATIVNRSPIKLKPFRSFPAPNSTPEDLQFKVWKALRASTAAPTYFNGFEEYVDGGLLANNPTIDTLVEYFSFEDAHAPTTSTGQSSQKSSKLKLVLSFGTGSPKPKSAGPELRDVFNSFQLFRHLPKLVRKPTGIKDAFKVRKHLQHIATQTDANIVTRADSWCSNLGVLYYRFNPLLQNKVSLAETNIGKLVEGLWNVKMWTVANAEQLKKVAAVMEAIMKSKDVAKTATKARETPK